MKALVVTLAYRRLGQAIVSQMKAMDNYAKRLDQLTLYGTPNPSAHAFQTVTDKYIEAQNYFLQGDWDTFIAVEDDMVLPIDSFARIEKGLTDCDVLYGVYVLRNMANASMLNAYAELGETEGESIVHDAPELAKEMLSNGSLYESAGVGMGLTAIKRHVMEAIPFERRDKYCNDWYFAVDCQKYGFKQMHDFGLQVGHMSLEPSPRILWPDAKTICRIEYL